MIIDKLEEQVRKYPHHIAIKTVKDELTYQQLNNYTNAVAREIISRHDDLGKSGREVAALLFEHGSEMIVGKFGALKAARIYMPLDPTYPSGLLTYMLEDSEASLMITNDKNVAFAKKLIGEVKREIVLINISQIKPTAFLANINPKCDGNEIAYILYTSGSTGRPKGVMQSHRNVLHFAECYRQTITITPEDRMTLLSSFSHDAGIGDICAALLNGASLYPLDVKSNIKMNEISHWLRAEQISIWYSVPTLYRHFMNTVNEGDEFPYLRFIILGGENVLLHDVKTYQQKFPTAKFAIMYGQSESSINTMQIYTADCQIEEVTLGEPVSETEVVVIDETRKEVNPLQIGEIVILSDYVALGYWRDEEKSKAVFRDIPGVGRTYATGDLGKLLPDGSIEFMGRKDFQVKVRGFRIELGGIENQLLEHPAVKEAVVIAREERWGDNYLCAYLVTDEAIGANELREYLRSNLPEYMIPSSFIQLEKMPLTPGGKVDRKALPEPGEREAKYTPPRNQVEEILVRIWSEVLDQERIGIADNFFELGGHSLKAAIVETRIQEELNVEVSLRELFRMPTISEISDYLLEAKERVYTRIESVPEKAYYEVSSAQKRMWLLWQLDPENIGYNMPNVLILDGNLEREHFETIFAKLVARHEVLRTSFEMIEDELVQRVSEEVAFAIENHESSEENIEAAITAFIRPFDLGQAPLLRVALIKTDMNRSYLLFDMHHIISDGMSMAILIREFMALYDGQELVEQRIRYKDFSAWQNEYLKSESMQKQEHYWLEQFAGELPLLNLPLDYSRPLVQSFAGEQVAFRLNKETTERLNHLARETSTTLYMVLLSAINILLSKYSGQMDIIVGSPIAGRPHADLEGIIGMFVNTLAMRNYPERDKPYVAFLQEVKETALTAYEHQDYQFEELVDKLNLRRDLSRNPLFDVMFIMQNMEARELSIEGLKLTKYHTDQIAAKFDLTFTATPVGSEMLFNIEYRTSLFKRATIERLSKHLQQLMAAITADQDVLLGEINVLSPAEQDQLLFKFNKTDAPYPKGQTIHQLFAEQVKKTPGHIALIFNGEEMTYDELNKKANQLAKILRASGVRLGDIVGIMVERSYEMLIGILGILKAGAAYLPIDVSFPEERIKFMMADSRVSILLTQSWLNDKGDFSENRVNLDQLAWDEHEAGNLECLNNSSDLAYVMYTSGSTGKPKGVMVEHQSVINLLYDLERHYPLGIDGAYLLKTPYIFDISVPELFSGFVSGAQLVILPQGAEKLPNEMIKTIARERVTHLNFVPSMLAVFLGACKDHHEVSKKLHTLKYVLACGEALRKETVATFYQLFKHIRLENLHGPTEATVYDTRYTTVADEENTSVPIGKPLSNYKIYILSEDNKLAPIGVAGELCVTGAGLARGYLNQDELTAEKFVSNPFIAGTRMYRTGDLARWLPDGNIEFLGRIDHQVKVRGFRIELGEIENQLLKLEAVKEAVVLARADGAGDRQLCAYFVSEVEVTANEFRQHLAIELPDYMIPSYFVPLEKMPLTANDKIDRQALPEPESKVEAEYVAPRNSTEELLAQIWSEVLGKEQIGIDDNFFELGGHSLKATVLVSKIHKEFNVEVQLKEFFRAPTIAGLCEAIAALETSVYEAIKVAEVKEHYEASHTQKRLWIINRLQPDSSMFNMPGRLTLYEAVERAIVQEIFDQLIERHEAFRTRFEKRAGSLVQIINSKSNFLMEEIDLSTLPGEEKEQARISVYENLAAKIFDLREGGLLDAKLIKISEREYDLIFCLHHIIADAWSMDILKKEFFMMYDAYKQQKEYVLHPLRIQYKDFAQWQNGLLENSKFSENAKAFWARQLSGELPTLSLPVDYQVAATDDKPGSAYKIALKGKIKDRLKEVAHQSQTSLFMVLITTFISFLSQLTKQEDLLIGVPTLGRGHEELHHVIGCFVNTTILRNQVNSDEKFTEALKTIDKNTLNALEYQDYPLELIMDELNMKYPQIAVFFNMLNFNESATQQLVDFDSLHTPNILDVKFDWEWNVTEYLNGLQVNCVYNARLFKPKTIEYIMNSYIDYVIKVSKNPDQLIKDYFADDKRRTF